MREHETIVKRSSAREERERLQATTIHRRGNSGDRARLEPDVRELIRLRASPSSSQLVDARIMRCIARLRDRRA